MLCVPSANQGSALTVLAPWNLTLGWVDCHFLRILLLAWNFRSVRLYNIQSVKWLEHFFQRDCPGCVLSSWRKLESSGKRNPIWEKCLLRLSIGNSMGIFLCVWLMIDLGGRRPQWVVLLTGQVSWVVQKFNLRKPWGAKLEIAFFHGFCSVLPLDSYLSFPQWTEADNIYVQ